jgi:flagellar biosynthetic protein FliR
MLGKMLNWSAIMFLGALLIALPVVMTLLFINIGLGFVARAAPTLNIFTVGFSALILTGFVIIIFSMGNNVARIEWVWTQAFFTLRSYLGG